MTMKAEFHTRAAESLTNCFNCILLNPYGRFKEATLWFKFYSGALLIQDHQS